MLGPRVMTIDREDGHDYKVTPFDFEVSPSKVKVTQMCTVLLLKLNYLLTAKSQFCLVVTQVSDSGPSLPSC